MIEFSTEKNCKAGKDHICNYCGKVIPKGTIYNHQSGKNDDGEFYTWNSHLRCNEIANAMWDFAADSWEGTMGAQEFWDGVRELLDLFVCDTCEHHHKWRDENGDCDIMHGAEYAPTGPEYCLDKLAELLRTHTLAEPCQENNWRWTLEEKKQEDVQ